MSQKAIARSRSQQMTVNEAAALQPFTGATLFGFQITPTGLHALTDVVPSEQDWHQLGAFLHFMKDSLPWLIGDWASFGETHYGERWSQAAEIAKEVGKGEGTVEQYAWVSRQVAPENRDAALSFSHHREVADLPPAEQRTWLKRAKAHGWSVQHLRVQLNIQKRAEKPIYWIVIGCKTAREREQVRKQFEKKGRQVKVP